MPVQKGRILHFKSPLGETGCAISALNGYEGLNQLYSFEATLIVDGEPVKPEKLLGQDVCITITNADIERKIHGIVAEFTELDPRGDNLFEYQVLVVPRLWLLGLNAHNRIFESMDVPAIVKQVVKDHCDLNTDDLTNKSYLRREICCQFGESDLDFVVRLLSEEGIAFCFSHTKSKCKLVLADSVNGFKDCDPKSFPYNERDDSPWKQRVSRFKSAGRLRTGKLTSTDYGEYAPSSPINVNANTTASARSSPLAEMEFHGRHDFDRDRKLAKGDCKAQATTWLAGMEADAAEFLGASAAPAFTAGHKFDLQDTPVSTSESSFLVTEVRHNAKEGNDGATVYSNTFRCIASSNKTAFTPRLSSDRPRIWGPQTAEVVEFRNPEADGKHAEVKVKFPWSGTQNSCWARVAQLYAGKKWGGFFVPDIGQEVLVEYFNGDPDRPVVMGAVYNADNQIPPYSKWQSGIRTRSRDYNELRFDDNPGSEEVYFQAGKDHNFLVKNNEKGEIKSNQNIEIGKKQDIKIGSNQGVDVGGGQKIDVGTSVDYSAGQSIKIDAGMNVEIKAGMSITLKVGGNTVKLDNTGVTVDGTLVTVKGKAMTEVSASGILTLRGALTKIN